MPTTKTFSSIFIKLYQHAKIKLIPLVNSILESRPDWPYQHAKNETVSSICSGEIVHLEILQSDWLRGFWPISQVKDFFPNIGFVQKHQQIKSFNIE